MKLAIEKTYPDECRSYELEKRNLMEELINSTPYDADVKMRMVMILKATSLEQLQTVFRVRETLEECVDSDGNDCFMVRITVSVDLQSSNIKALIPQTT